MRVGTGVSSLFVIAVALALVSCAAEQVRPTPTERDQIRPATAQAPTEANANHVFTFRAEHLRTLLLSGFAGEVVSTDFDPRYVVTLKLLDPVGDFKKGDVVHFAIHSPARSWISDETPQVEHAVGTFQITRTASGEWRHLTRKMEWPELTP